MALPTSYLTSTKNLEGMFNAILGAQAPDKFTTRFLESLDYKSAPDRLIIGVLKSLGMLADDGRPTQLYFEYLDQSQSGVVLAKAVRNAYGDLFQVNKSADKMQRTFTALCALADFETPPAPAPSERTLAEAAPASEAKGLDLGERTKSA